MKHTISFNLNGEPVSVQVNGDESVLTVLRTYLDRTGTKYGCGLGECGSCTVIMDKEAVRSCMITAEDLAGKEITTIEGLSAGGTLHPLQKAFIAHDALQCGFCTPGMILSAKAMLDESPKPTEEEVKTGISGNLCRCTGYTKIIEAITATVK